MKILGMGLPELLMVLLFIGVLILIVVLVLWRSSKKKQSILETPCQQDGSFEVLNTSQVPVLETWKTSVGFSVLGAIVGFPLVMLLMILLSSLVSFGMASGIGAAASMAPELASTVASALVTPIAAIIFYILTIVYATVFYPSYFGSKPKLRSSRAISFLNLTFGFVIFGALWNSALTKRSKGSSHIVLVVLTALMIVSAIMSVCMTAMQARDYDGAPVNASASQPSAGTHVESAAMTASAGNIVFTYPEDWVLMTEDDFENLDNIQIMGVNPTSFSSVGPEEDTSVVFTAYYVPNFDHSFDDLREQVNASDQFDAKSIRIGDHEAIQLIQANEAVTNVIIIPNVEGKITSIFSGSYPSNDADCAAVVDSLTLK